MNRLLPVALLILLTVGLPALASGIGESGNARNEAASKRPAPSLALSAYPEPVSGEYVVYRDYSWKEPTWVGFLYYDESTWGTFLYTPSSNSRVSVLFRAEAVGTSLVLLGQNIISKIGPGDVEGVNYLMGLLPELYQKRAAAKAGTTEPDGIFAAVSGRSTLLPAALFTTASLESLGGNLRLAWAPEVPVFNLLSATGKDGSSLFGLERAGRIGPGGDALFFDFQQQNTVVSQTPSMITANRPKESRTLEGVRISLDDQWTMIADNTFFMGNTAVLIADSFETDALRAGAASLAAGSDLLPLACARLFGYSGDAAISDPASFTLQGSAEKFVLAGVFQDRASGNRNRSVKLFALSPDRSRCVVISLTVSEAAYQANRAYFDGLF